MNPKIYRPANKQATANRLFLPGGLVRPSSLKELEEWIQGCCQQATQNNHVATAAVTLTPAMAKHLLRCNTHNRYCSAAVAQRYKVDMENDGWVPNVDPLIITCDAILVNGQHRLLALLNCLPGTRISFQISFMYFEYDSEECRQLMSGQDRGRIRRPGDQVQLTMGMDARSAPIMRLAYFISSRERSITPQEWSEIAPIFRDDVEMLLEHMVRMDRRLKTNAILAAMLRAAPYMGHKRMIDFIHVYRKGPDAEFGVGEGYKQTAVLFREKVFKTYGTGKDARNKLYQMACNALAAWMDSKRIRTFKSTIAMRNGKYNERFPLPTALRKIKARWDKALSAHNITKESMDFMAQQKKPPTTD